MQTIIDSIRQDRTVSLYAPKIAYILSGGSAKGFCHLGMIEALETRGIKPDLVVGTSAGALFGALYCHFGSVEGVLGRVEEVFASSEFAAFSRKYLGEPKGDEDTTSKWKQFVSTLSGTVKKGIRIGQTLARQAMVNERDVSAIFSEIFRGIDFATLKIPFAAVASDLGNAVPAVFSSLNKKGSAPGDDSRNRVEPPLARAVMASTAIPFLFPSVEIGGRDHADGYLMANLPVREARVLMEGGLLFVAGFDVSAPLVRPDEELSSLELVMRLLDLAAGSKQAADRELADVLFRPIDRNYAWSSFDEYRIFIDIGRNYMSEEKVDAFLTAYRDKCAIAIAAERRPVRRFFAERRLGKMAPRA